MRHTLIVLAMAAALSAGGAHAVQIPSGKSDLYYRLGGDSPASRAPNPAATSMKLGLSGVMNLNYSCGQFDFGASWQTLMNGFSNLGTTITGAVQAGISALPLYILQRAQPGLYELFQTYAAKAEELVQLSTKSCQQMEREILANKNPYAGWVSLSMGEDWKREAKANNGDIARAAENVGKADGRNGLTWIGGAAGGKAQKAINVIGDTTRAGYNATQMLAPATNSGPYPTNRLSAAFPGPTDAAAFATDVLGEEYISTCAEGGCPTRAAGTALGLLPKFEAEIPTAQAQFATVMGAAVPSASDLDAASAPGVPVSRDLIEAIRALPPVEQPMAEGRIARDVALARTVDKALTVRNLLITGRSVPEVQGNAQATARIDLALEQLNRHIDDLLYEARVRRELVSGPAQTLLRDHRVSQDRSRATGTGGLVDNDRLENGRVK